MHTSGSEPSVRQMLATRTRKVHLELHEHLWIASLGKPELTLCRYAAVLGAYHRFYTHVEQACSNHPVPPNLSIRPARERLDADMDCLAARHASEPTPSAALPVELEFKDPLEALGALYVLHGSGFGATILNRNVRDVLPDAPRHFLAAGTERDLWQQLNQELERACHDDLARARILAGANATFQAFGRYVTRYCEDRLPMHAINCNKRTGM